MNRNKTIFIVVIALLGIAFIITLFVSLPAKKKANLPPGVHGVMVTEVLQTNNYTYLNVKEEDRVYWMAINAAEIAVGVPADLVRRRPLQPLLVLLAE